MIQRAFITQWGTVVPWTSPRLVEQDLIICRALVSIYNDPFLSEHLAFRGGTALHKLYLRPQPRYSEDIDLVQVNAEPIKETIDHLRDAFAWLGEPVVKQKKHNNTLLFKVQPTDVGAMLEYDSQAAWERVRDEIVAKLLPSKQVKDREKGQNPY